MPVIRSTAIKAHIDDIRGEVKKRILTELLNGTTEGGPLIYEIPTGPPGMVDVIVLWDEWFSIPAEARGPIIREAYAEYFQGLKASRARIGTSVQATPHSVPRLGTVTGATWDEDENLNFLPFSIRPGGTYRTKLSAAARRIMTDLGAAKTPGGLALRYPTQELAEQALATLTERFPEGKWGILVRSDPIEG